MPLRNFRLRSNNPPKAAQRNAAESAADTQKSNPDAFFPFVPYVSATGVHACLLVFVALFLPRTSLSFLTSLNPFQDNDAAATGSHEASASALYLLTSSPLRTVLWMCSGTLVLQAWWAGWLRTWAAVTRGHASGERDAAEMTKERLERGLLTTQRMEALKNAAIATSLVSLAFHALIVLFGAPIASHSVQTYSLALLLALLTTWAPSYTLGRPALGSTTEALVTRLAWIRLFAELRPRTAIERAMVYPAIGSVLGCWSGVIPIGLDWERPWQAWPLTPAYGAISGHIVGSVAALMVTAVTYFARADILSRTPQTSAKKQPKTKQH